MSSVSSTLPNLEIAGFASRSEIARCFDEHGPLLTRLALLITGDDLAAEHCVESARESTLRSNSPFRNWILEWAKTSTVQIALLRSAQLIKGFESIHKDPICDHPEHLSDPEPEGIAFWLQRLMQVEGGEIISGLDPLCRAVLVLRVALRSSIQECAFRLNVTRPAILDANCRAMEWLSPHW